ncbi:MAG: YitT family protein [candidate division WOR-3 bacterium]
MRKFTQHFFDFCLIIVGSVIMGLAYNLFLIPHRIVPGGVNGLSIVINFLLRTPVGLVGILFNIPLFILGVKTLGKVYGIKSLFGIILSSLFIDFFTYVVPIPSATNNTILAAIYGGVLLGVGLGAVFRGQGSTGGTDIIGQVLNRYTNLSIGMGILITDFIIISLAALVFRKLESALYGYLTLFLSSKAIDLISEGWSFTRAVYIISDKATEIAQVIIDKMGRGVTRFYAKGEYTNVERDVLLCVLTKREIAQIRNYVKEIDPNAFIIISDVYEVLGKGFRPRL